MAKAAPKRKAANGYKLAERLPKGEILEDINKKKWKLGVPIGQGGFGEIYTAQEGSSTGSNYPYVIKIEPHTNGPLFVEMHFYLRNAKTADVEEFKKEKGLKTFGMPLYLGSGSHEYKNEKYRFVVMEKFGMDLWKIFLDNNKVLPADTVFKIAIQILDVLEYIHKRGYVHADIKGANILMGVNKGTTNQAYLVDFGLATKYTTEKLFKPNPKKAHDGTIEYLSRDAHKGVQTMRGDLEILAYNLIQWLGCTLPWEKNLKDPNSVHKNKEEHMDNVPKMIKACFGHRTPQGAIVDYLNYLKTLEFNTEPNYTKIRKIFQAGIKDAGGSEKSPLNFTASKKTPQKRKSERSGSLSPKRKAVKGKKAQIPVKAETENLDDEEDDKEDEVIPDEKKTESDVDEDDIIDESYVEEPKPKRRGLKEKGNELPAKKTAPKKNSKKIEQNDSDVETGNKKSSKKTKAEAKNDNDDEESDTKAPAEGYNAAMKEVLVKKQQNGKSKRQRKMPVTAEDSMEGFTDTMKEMAVKKKERLATKRKVKGKKEAPSTSVTSESSGMTRGNRLRAHKEVCYGEFDSD